MRCSYFYAFAFAGSLVANSNGYSQQSATGNLPNYVNSCALAAQSAEFFASFRSFPDYRSAVECGFGLHSALYLIGNTCVPILAKLEQCRKLDQYGNPITENQPWVGQFSATTLRYMVIADNITRRFKLPDQPKIVEIGAGFGGQCYILSQIIPFSHYFIFDLPQVQSLIGKMLKILSVQNVFLVPFNDSLPEEKVDLLISNYAFSECDRQTQLDYFEKVFKKADRGYVIFNQLGDLDSLSPVELMTLLEENNMHPQLCAEPVNTHPLNILITWDKTKN